MYQLQDITSQNTAILILRLCLKGVWDPKRLNRDFISKLNSPTNFYSTRGIQSLKEESHSIRMLDSEDAGTNIPYHEQKPVRGKGLIRQSTTYRMPRSWCKCPVRLPIAVWENKNGFYMVACLRCSQRSILLTSLLLWTFHIALSLLIILLALHHSRGVQARVAGKVIRRNVLKWITRTEVLMGRKRKTVESKNVIVQDSGLHRFFLHIN
jgi:hypothetical protein